MTCETDGGGKLLCNREPSLAPVMTESSGVGKGGGPEGRGICVTTADSNCLWQKPTQHYKAIFLQLKNKLKNRREITKVLLFINYTTIYLESLYRI